MKLILMNFINNIKEFLGEYFTINNKEFPSEYFTVNNISDILVNTINNISDILANTINNIKEYFINTNLFEVDQIITITIMIVFFAFIRFGYSRHKSIQGFMIMLKAAIKDNTQENMGNNQYWWLFAFYTLLIFFGGILGTLGLGDIFSICGDYTSFFIVSIALLIMIIESFRKKGIKLISDITDPDLPIIGRIIFFPVELIMILAKGCILPIRLAIHTYVSHKITHVLLDLISSQIHGMYDNYSVGIQLGITVQVFIVIKFIEILSSAIQAMIFLITSSMWFGRIYQKEH